MNINIWFCRFICSQVISPVKLWITHQYHMIFITVNMKMFNQPAKKWCFRRWESCYLVEVTQPLWTKVSDYTDHCLLVERCKWNHKLRSSRYGTLRQGERSSCNWSTADVELSADSFAVRFWNWECQTVWIGELCPFFLWQNFASENC